MYLNFDHHPSLLKTIRILNLKFYGKRLFKNWSVTESTHWYVSDKNLICFENFYYFLKFLNYSARYRRIEGTIPEILKGEDDDYYDEYRFVKT